MKQIIFLLMTFILLTFTACSDSGKTAAYAPTGKAVKVVTYKFGVHPYLNSKKMYQSYRPILDYLENEIGDVKIVLETSVNYAKYEEKLYRGDFDFSLPNPFQTYNSLSHGYKVIARMKPDSSFRGIFVARKDSHLKRIGQLKGKKISFPAPTALAASMMPLYYLYEHGIDVKKDIKKMYVGSQYSSILNAYSSDTIAGATWPTSWKAWLKENPEKEKDMEIVWETESLINNGVIAKKNLDNDLVAKVRVLLTQLDKIEEGKKLLENAEFDGFQKSVDSDSDSVKIFLAKYDSAIGLPE